VFHCNLAGISPLIFILFELPRATAPSNLKKMHDTGIGYCRIAYCLNEQGYTTPRVHKFKILMSFLFLKKKKCVTKARTIIMK
jgi:hypothetical protein